MRSVFLMVLVRAAATVAAQTEPEQGQGVATVLVPVVGSVIGAGEVHWRTDVELRNDLSTEVTVILTMPTCPDSNFIVQPLSPGGAVRLNDVAAALGVENGLSPLVVQTNARRSVSIRATAYGTRGDEIFPPQPIGVNYGPDFYPVRVLRDLSFSSAYRTNIGLVNLGTAAADFTLALQRVPGRNVAVTRLTIPPNAIWHMSIQAAFPLITDGDHFTVVVETGAADTHTYASVIENATNRARFVQAGLGPSPGAVR